MTVKVTGGGAGELEVRSGALGDLYTTEQPRRRHVGKDAIPKNTSKARQTRACSSTLEGEVNRILIADASGGEEG